MVAGRPSASAWTGSSTRSTCLALAHTECVKPSGATSLPGVGSNAYKSARRGRSELTATILRAGELADLVERMLPTSGRRIDKPTPFVDGMLPDGSRLPAPGRPPRVHAAS